MDRYILRSCPRCGDMIYRYFSHYHGWQEECFRCGFRPQQEATIPEKETVSQSAGSPVKEPVPV
ncbi:MAG: hypothetical protein NUV31_02285 [Dehalococcoidales bacterium]|nr:hypothetical protein [Dehalococcoidales bacterium]